MTPISSSRPKGWVEATEHQRSGVYQGDQAALQMRCLEMRQRVDELEQRMQLLSQQLEVPLGAVGLVQIHEIHLHRSGFVDGTRGK